MEELVAQPAPPVNYEDHRSIPWQETGGRLARRLLAGLALTAAFGASPATAQPLNAERGVGLGNCVECTFSPALASTPDSQAAQRTLPDAISRAHESDNTIQTLPGPHLEIGSEDDAVVESFSPARMATAAEQARSMGASWWRTIIYPKDVVRSHWKKYDLAVSEATRQGLDVNLTLACNQEHWTVQTFQRYVTAVVQRYDRRGVREYSICNEPNYPKWLDRMPGETLPQTYRQLYQIGYAAVKEQAQLDGVDDDVFIFELSSEFQPIKFIKDTLACPLPDPSGCAPLETDGFAYHPYQLSTQPTKSSSIPGEVGIGSLPVLEAALKSEYDAGMIETPDHQEPKLELTEFAYLVQNRNQRSNRHLKGYKFLPDSTRRWYYLQALQIACSDENVARLSFYEIDSPPAQAKGAWDSSLFTPSGKPYQSFEVVQSFAKSHPECVTR